MGRGKGGHREGKEVVKQVAENSSAMTSLLNAPNEKRVPQLKILGMASHAMQQNAIAHFWINYSGEIKKNLKRSLNASPHRAYGS